MIKAVIFDLDDTLISEKEYIISGYCYIAKLLSARIGIDENKIFSDLKEIFQQNPKNVFNRFFEKNGIEYSKELIFDLVNEYRNHLPRIKFYDDVLPCLNEIKNMGIKAGIITDGYVVAQRQKLKVVEANKYFDEIILTDEMGQDYWKPHPKAFDLMKEKLAIAFEEMIYVGDNPEKDFYISKIYPIKTIRIYRNGVHQNKSYLEGIKENYGIRGLNKVRDLILANK